MLAVFAGAMVALAAALWWWQPVIERWLAAAPVDPVVARVDGVEITRGQLERAWREHLWFAGKTAESLTATERRATRAAALEELIDQELLRVKAGANAAQLEVGDAEIDERLARFRGCFESPAALAAAMKAQGIDGDGALRARMAARIQQEKYVELRLRPITQVSDDEARRWYEANRGRFVNPERVEVRHVFLPTLDHPSEQARATLAAAMDDLTAGRRDFAQLARDLSEDPATNKQGGQLGWMSRARLPADFAEAVFALPPKRPALIQTRLGWHIVEVTAKQPAQDRSFEQAKPDILAALTAVKRQQAVHQFRGALRRFAGDKVQVAREELDR